jgi:hypothetical protein
MEGGTMRDLEFLWKDEGSQVSDCPALYECEGGYIVQGKTLDLDTRGALRQLSSDEDAVFVPANVLDRLAAYRAETA